MLSSLLSVSLFAANETEVIAKLASENPGIRKVAAEEARLLPPSDLLLRALIEAASKPISRKEENAQLLLEVLSPTPSTQSADWLAKEAAGRALVSIGRNSIAVGEFFVSDKINNKVLYQLGRQYLEGAGAPVLSALAKRALTSEDLEYGTRIVCLLANAGHRLDTKSAQKLLNRLSQGLPILDAQLSSLPEEWERYLRAASILRQSGARDEGAAQKLRLYLESVTFPIEPQDPYSIKRLIIGQLSECLAEVDPQTQEALKTLQALTQKAASAGQLEVRDDLLRAQGLARTGTLTDQELANARRFLDTLATRLKNHDSPPETLPPFFVVKNLKVIEDPQERVSYLKKIVTRMMKSADPSWRKIAHETVYRLWEDEESKFREELRQSRTCTALLKRLSEKGLIHLPGTQ